MSDEHIVTEDSREEHSSREGADSDAEQPEKPGLGEAVTNARILLRRTTIIMVILWMAIVLFSLYPLVFSEMLLSESLRSRGGSLLASSFGAMPAFAVMVLFFSVSREHLRAEKCDAENPIIDRRQLLRKNVLTAFGMAIFYHYAVFVGLWAFLIPGLIIAFLFVPALYLSTVGGYSERRALAEAPGHAVKHWQLNSVAVLLVLGTFYGVPISMGVALERVSPEGSLSAVTLDPLFAVTIAAGFFIAITFQYALFLVATGALAAMEG